jgi:hypothetical protein
VTRDEADKWRVTIADTIADILQTNRFRFGEHTSVSEGVIDDPNEPISSVLIGEGTGQGVWLDLYLKYEPLPDWEDE